MFKWILTLLLITFQYPYSAHAFGLQSFKDLHLSIGTWLENYGQVQINNSGDTNDDFEINPYLTAGLEYELKPQFSLLPEVGWVIQRTENDISKNIFFLRGDFIYSPWEFLRLRLGTSFVMTSISASGGEDTLRNGSGTEVYYIPAERRTATNQTLDLGVEYIKDNMGVKLQNYIFAWNESSERMITYSLSFNYYIPMKDLL